MPATAADRSPLHTSTADLQSAGHTGPTVESLTPETVVAGPSAVGPLEDSHTEESFIPAPTVEDMLSSEHQASLKAEVERLRALNTTLDERIVTLSRRIHQEERRGDTWQELALRGEERSRLLTLELERYRGFAHAPWWRRARGLKAHS